MEGIGSRQICLIFIVDYWVEITILLIGVCLHIPLDKEAIGVLETQLYACIGRNNNLIYRCGCTRGLVCSSSFLLTVFSLRCMREFQSWTIKSSNGYPLYKLDKIGSLSDSKGGVFHFFENNKNLVWSLKIHNYFI